MLDFNLTEAISTFKTQESHYRELEGLPIDFDVEELVSSVVPIPNSPLDILSDDKFNDFCELLHHVHLIQQQKYVKIIYQAISDSLKSEVTLIEREGPNIDAFDHKLALNRFGYLLFVTVSQLTNDIDQCNENMLTLRKKKGKEKSTSNEAKIMRDQKDKLRQPMSLFIQLMSNVCSLLKINLISIFQMQTELSTFIMHAISNSLTCAFRTSYVTKEKDSRLLLLNYMCLCAKNQQQYDQIAQMIVHHIKLSEHLPEFMAEVLTMLVNDYDNKTVLNTVLTELSELDLSGNNSKLTLQKHFSLFLVKLSEGLAPILIGYNDLLINFMGQSAIIRAAVIESYENILKLVISNEEYYVEQKTHIDNIFDLIHSRLFDSHFSVRQKCLNLIDHLLRDPNRKVPFKEYRLKWVTIASQYLEDRTIYSRKAALSLLGALVLDHPYNIDGQKLSWKFYWNNYLAFSHELKELNSQVYSMIRNSEVAIYKTVEENGLEMEPYYILKQYEESDDVKSIFQSSDYVDENIDLGDDLPENVNEIILKRAFCRDACTFIAQIHKSVESACLLFHSKSKLDAINAMDYFVILDAYDIETSKMGIKQMLHLVWRNGSNEDDIKVLHRLIECYISIFLTPPPDVSREHQAVYVAAQLINLTYNCNEADLISLGRLIYEIYTYTYQKGHKYEGQRAEWINDLVISVLWKSFCQPKYEREKTGAIIILTMLADADNAIIFQKLDQLLEFGLINTKVDQSTIYSCIALRKSIPESHISDYTKAIEKLRILLLTFTRDGLWYHMAEEALTTLYEIDPNANETTSEILKMKAMSIFGDDDDISNDDKLGSLSQFIFLLGHIGLKTIIYLEKCEAEFKKKKLESNNEKDEQEMELEMIGGSNEDDFADVIQNIREKELLYGQDSLLAKFVPLILEILTKRFKYPHSMLQRQTTLCLGKFMCISPFFCEQHIDLYIKLTTSSNDTIIRSNGILGLGDMAVSFNNLIDERRDDLYRPLLDNDITVQRTCLMTVTFLILAGQIKVKGQLAQLSKLLVHEDPTIKEMTKLFFLELATKDNAIYNGFIDMVGGLNNDMNFNEENFKSIIKYVSQFLKKDKHRTILIKKFHERLLKENDERCWKNLSFCIKELIRRDEIGFKSLAASKEINDNGESTKAKKQEMYKEILAVIDKGFQRSKLDELEEMERESEEKIKSLKEDIELEEAKEKKERRASRRVKSVELSDDDDDDDDDDDNEKEEDVEEDSKESENKEMDKGRQKEKTLTGKLDANSDGDIEMVDSDSSSASESESEPEAVPESESEPAKKKVKTELETEDTSDDEFADVMDFSD